MVMAIFSNGHGDCGNAMVMVVNMLNLSFSWCEANIIKNSLVPIRPETGIVCQNDQKEITGYGYIITSTKY